MVGLAESTVPLEDERDRVEEVYQGFLASADENPSLAGRMAVMALLQMEGRVREREKRISNGYVRSALPRCRAKGTR